LTPPRKQKPEATSDDAPIFPPEISALGTAYMQLCEVERGLRILLHAALSAKNIAYEDDSRIIPSNVRADALAAMERETAVLGARLSPKVIEYVDFGFVLELMARNWDSLENAGLSISDRDWELIKRDLVPLRNAVMHSRRLRRSDRATIESIHARVLRAIEAIVQE
jgi:hypothetical protein